MINDPKPEKCDLSERSLWDDRLKKTCEMLIVMRMWHVEFVTGRQGRSRRDTRRAHQKLSSEDMYGRGDLHRCGVESYPRR